MSNIRLKEDDNPRNPYGKYRNVQFRISEGDYAILKQKATLYTDGNLSHWIRVALKNYKPKMSDIEIIDD